MSFIASKTVQLPEVEVTCVLETHSDTATVWSVVESRVFDQKLEEFPVTIDSISESEKVVNQQSSVTTVVHDISDEPVHSSCHGCGCNATIDTVAIIKNTRTFKIPDPVQEACMSNLEDQSNVGGIIQLCETCVQSLNEHILSLYEEQKSSIIATEV